MLSNMWLILINPHLFIRCMIGPLCNLIVPLWSRYSRLTYQWPDVLWCPDLWGHAYHRLVSDQYRCTDFSIVGAVWDVLVIETTAALREREILLHIVNPLLPGSTTCMLKDMWFMRLWKQCTEMNTGAIAPCNTDHWQTKLMLVHISCQSKIHLSAFSNRQCTGG